MELVRIFADSLFAIHNNDEEDNEFEKLFELWTDVEYLENFFEENKADLESGFYGNISVEEAVKKTRNEAKSLQKELRKLAFQINEGSTNGLISIFKPLDNTEFRHIELSKNKAYGIRKSSWLRIYAIKVDNNIFVVTGGAIKLTKTMNERKHTLLELQKLTKSRDYLRNLDIFDEQSFKDLEI